MIVLNCQIQIRRNEVQLKHFTEEDLNEPKFHVGQVFSSIALLRHAIREYSCKERLQITFPKNDKTRIGAKCNDGCPWYLYASYDNRTRGIMVKTFKDEHTCSKKWHVKLSLPNT